jgi:hypothetical protein
VAQSIRKAAYSFPETNRREKKVEKSVKTSAIQPASFSPTEEIIGCNDEPGFYSFIGFVPELIGVALIFCGFLFAPRPSLISQQGRLF